MLETRVAAGAFHNSSERFDPPKCHPKTRVAMLKKIWNWFRDEETAAPHIMWLYGPAGAGKSAIAQTMAEEFHELRILAASFFFSRTAPGRNDATRLIPTIAYQIAQDIEDIRPHIQQALENDPMIFSKSLETQLYQLVTKPLLDIVSDNSPYSWPWRKLIIIDGLDECNGGEIQQAIIHCLASSLTRHALPLRVLILSRPEQPIRDSFSRPERRWIHASLVLDDNYQADEDIKLFLKEKFNDIRQTHVLKAHIPETWPSDDDIFALVRKSSGQFIFASTIIQYTKSPRHRPMDRLQHVLGIGSREDVAPFAELDALYIHILQSVDEAHHDAILRIFGFLVCTPSLKMHHPFDIEHFVNLAPGDLYLVLADCHSIVKLPPPTDMRTHIDFLHASISDFLVDPARSQRFFVDQGMVHAEQARACMKEISNDPDSVYHYYCKRSLLHHIKRARMDETLLEDLLHFNLTGFIMDSPGQSIHLGTPQWHIYKPCLRLIARVGEQVRMPFSEKAWC